MESLATTGYLSTRFKTREYTVVRIVTTLQH
jgi:hypothetical protein